MKKTIRKLFILCSLFAAMSFSGCSKSQSYSELLRDEEEATNWFMADQRVITEIPKDSIFECGEDAPFYKMDEDGYLYMQVVNPGTKDNKAQYNDKIYFRYLRTNILEMYSGLNPKPSGNANTVVSDVNYTSSSFRFNNFDVTSSSTYGSGIQTPLQFLGIDCEVNLVMRSYYGFSSDQSQCIPYYVNVKYFKADY